MFRRQQRLDKPDMALLKNLAEFASVGGVFSKDGFVINDLHELSVKLCVLCKLNLCALPHVSGNGFHASADISTSKSNSGCCFPFRLTVSC